ncbi:aminopeptidase (Met-Xaa and Xaa-Pro, Xaa-Pro-Xaa) [Candidatus Hydrogenisulfobacillus filiaventi]|uniref:Aminopeptidase (Met-Xaa and Xaa-Pro, Xaa-Pro-Xaa) n=1 Tax=Candidatus Hydrogenisulfobacillus filiaventi TaxID=2707344 RepID=A0A6F8ZG05_9FIRM|nr:aminopeptidase P family protein [Bacillota bacterium]CAB1128919.1 aminopeptidase (Met-Xaa and Xaa-Pro, Xaa-Pro-Xaa) [Candidatus Hydrogenisulfobacillus filiaventi]
MSGERRQRLAPRLAEAGLDALLVWSSPNRRYLSGFTGSSAYLLAGADGRGLLLTDFRYLEQAAAQAPGWTVIRHGRDVWSDLAGQAAAAGWRTVGVEADHVTLAAFRRLEAAGEARGITWRPVSGLVEGLRLVKTPDEVEAVRAAAALARRALEAVWPRLVPGVSEAEVALELECTMRRLGAEAEAFPTIVASGPRGSLPHARPGPRRLEAGDLVTIDFGARLDGYHSDETVTVGIGAAAAAHPLRPVYEVVRRAQAAGIAAIRPGVPASAVDRAARGVIEEAGYGEAFGHSTGHGVGLEVHEAPWAAAQPPVDYVLEPGMILTVEPGIYLPGRGGVRLEDTLVVTETGCERLTTWDKDWRTT